VPQAIVSALNKKRHYFGIVECAYHARPVIAELQPLGYAHLHLAAPVRHERGSDANCSVVLAGDIRPRAEQL
jgi:hypothetical protein